MARTKREWVMYGGVRNRYEVGYASFLIMTQIYAMNVPERYLEEEIGNLDSKLAHYKQEHKSIAQEMRWTGKRIRILIKIYMTQRALTALRNRIRGQEPESEWIRKYPDDFMDEIFGV